MTVSGGPGDATGSNPYVVTFGGTLGGADRPELSIDRTRLARPVGSQLSCKGTARYVIAEGSFDFRWLRNGVPIEGATGQTYTTTAADSGKAVQCEVEATYENDEPFQHGWATNNDYALIGSTPAPPPPLPPAEIASPSGPALIGAPSGHLTCDAGTWQNGPTSYRYQWFGHFAELADVTTASSDERTRAQRRGPRRRRDIPVQGHGHQRRGQCRDVEPSQAHRTPRSPHRRHLQLRIPGRRSLTAGWARAASRPRSTAAPSSRSASRPTPAKRASKDRAWGNSRNRGASLSTTRQAAAAPSGSGTIATTGSRSSQWQGLRS